MPREQIRALADDVDRLLAAGAATAPGDEKLCRRERALREMGQKVPVLARVADAVRRVVEADTAQAAAPLLDLLSIVRQVRAGLTTAGVEGELTPIETFGSWASETPARDLYRVVECLARSGAGRTEVIVEAVRREVVADLRLVDSLLCGLDHGHSELAHCIAAGALPAFGRAVLPELRRGLAIGPRSKGTDARRLAAIVAIDPKEGAALCRAALDQGSSVLRIRALTCLAAIDPAEAERRALELLAGTPAREVRVAALAALQGARSDAALEALVAAVADHPVDALAWQATQSALKALPHPRAHERLVQELEAVAARAGSAPAPKAGTMSANAKGRVQATEPDDEEQTRWIEQACRLVEILKQRGDRRSVAALLPLIEHGASDLREAAVVALTELGDPAGLEAAATLVGDSRVWKAAARAAWKLPSRPRYELLAPLCESLSDPKKARHERGKFIVDDLFTAEATSAQPRTDWDPRWADLLRTHLDGPLRSDVALALAVVQGAAALPELLRVLEPSVKKDECGVVEGLGLLRAREAIGPLLALMLGQKAHHFCIHDALRKIGDPAIVPALKAILGMTKNPTKAWRLRQLIAQMEAQEVS
jgi:HEAT repeat protein